MSIKSVDLLVSCYFEERGDRWIGYCLDYSLVTQAASLSEAHDKLMAQIDEYVADALVGEDKQHAAYLLRRSAPAKYWLKFYWTMLRQHLNHMAQVSARRKAERTPVPLAPSCA